MKKIIGLIMLMTIFQLSAQTDNLLHKIYCGLFIKKQKKLMKKYEKLKTKNVLKNVSNNKNGDYFKKRGDKFLKLSKELNNCQDNKEETLLNARDDFYYASEFFIKAHDETKNIKNKKRFIEKAEDAMDKAETYENWYLQEKKGSIDTFKISGKKFQLTQKINECRKSIQE